MTSGNNAQQLSFGQAMEVIASQSKKIENLSLETRWWGDAPTYAEGIQVAKQQLLNRAMRGLESETCSLEVINTALKQSYKDENVQKAVRVLLIMDTNNETRFTEHGFGSCKEWLEQCHTKKGKLEGQVYYEHLFATVVHPALRIVFPQKEAAELVHDNILSFIANQPTAVSNEMAEGKRTGELDFLVKRKKDGTAWTRDGQLLYKQVPEILLDVINQEKVKGHLDESYTWEQYIDDIHLLWKVMISDEDYLGEEVTHLDRFHALVAIYKKIYHAQIEEQAEHEKKEQDMLKSEAQVIWLGTTVTKNGHALAFIPTTIDARVMELFREAGIQIVYPNGIGTVLQEADYEAINAVKSSLAPVNRDGEWVSA